MTSPCSTDTCSMLPAIQDLSSRVRNIERAQQSESDKLRAGMTRLTSKIDGVDRKLDRVIEGLLIGSIVSHPEEPYEGGNGKLPELSWEDEDTGLHEVAVWAGRAKEGAGTIKMMDSERHRLAVENAALKAAIEEREKIRMSSREDRNHSTELSIKRWQIVAGLLTTILGSGVITIVVSYLLGR